MCVGVGWGGLENLKSAEHVGRLQTQGRADKAT